LSVELYPHNQKTYDRMGTMFTTSNRVAVVQPTGSGKSFLYLKWIEDNPGDSFIVLSPSNEIFVQLGEYEKSSDISILSTVRMITYQSLLYMSNEEIESIKADKIVLDEFHRIGAEQWEPAVQKLLDENPDALILGATATPIRYLDGGKNMAERLFNNNFAQNMTLGDAVREGILPTPKYVPAWYDIANKLDAYEQDIATIKDEAERKTFIEQLEQLRRTLENSYGAEDIFREHMPHDHGKYIVFCRDTEHLNEMLTIVPKWMAKVNKAVRSYVSISTEVDKDAQLQAFKRDDSNDAIKLLFTIDRLNEGVHVKGINGVIMLRPTISPIIYLQQMGRALAAGKQTPIIFDLVNNYSSVRVPIADGSSRNVFEFELSGGPGPDTDQRIFHIFGAAIQFMAMFDSLEYALYPTNDQLWHKMFALYKKFKGNYHREPKGGERFEGYSFENWIATQRKTNKNGSLREDRKQLLLAEGFCFSISDSAWNEMFELYKRFQKIYHRDPKQKEMFEDYPLGDWAGRQRRANNKGLLLEDRKQLLLKEGFCFDKKDSIWNEFFSLYREFKTTYHREPRSTEKYKGCSLGPWACNQRQANKKGTLREDRKQLLLKEGFCFDVALRYSSYERWEESYYLYKKFKATYNREPRTQEKFEGHSLGAWVTGQRQAYKNGTLHENRKQLLLKEGFRFGILDVAWNKSFELYKKFKATYHREPRTVEKFEGYYLGPWVCHQRQANKKGTLCEDRKQLLLANGFCFDANDSLSWEESFSLYRKFKVTYRREPRSDEIFEGYTIGRWVNRQRTANKKGVLREDRKMLLLAEGFCFNASVSLSWEESFSLYKKFKATYNREPLREEEFEGSNIRSWVDMQRRINKKGMLREDRKKLLLAEGFCFDKRDLAWSEAFFLYKRFKSINQRDPKSAEKFEGFSLGAWAKNQRLANKNGTLHEYRKKLLLAEGFRF